MFEINDATSFSVVDEIAQMAYKRIGKLERTEPVKRKVHFLKEGGGGDTKEIEIREFKGINDIQREMHYYGEKGPAPRAQHGTDPEKVYYFFGDWVLSMTLDQFYINVEGIIDSPEKIDQINEIKKMEENPRKVS